LLALDTIVNHKFFQYAAIIPADLVVLVVVADLVDLLLIIPAILLILLFAVARDESQSLVGLVAIP